jgi:putative transposase
MNTCRLYSDPTTYSMATITLQQGQYYHLYNRGNNREDLFHSTNDYKHFLRLYEKYIFPIADTYAWVLMKNHFHLLIRIKDREDIGEYKIRPFNCLNADGTLDYIRFKDEKWETIPGNLSGSGNLTGSFGPGSITGTDSVARYNSNAPTEYDGQVARFNSNAYQADVTGNVTSSTRVTFGNFNKIPNPTLHFSHLFNAYAKYVNKVYGRTGSLFEKPFRRKQVTSREYFLNLVIYIHQNPQHHGFTSDFKDYPWSSYGTILSHKNTRLCRNEVLGWFDDHANFIEVHGKKNNFEDIQDLIIDF